MCVTSKKPYANALTMHTPIHTTHSAGDDLWILYIKITTQGMHAQYIYKLNQISKASGSLKAFVEVLWT